MKVCEDVSVMQESGDGNVDNLLFETIDSVWSIDFTMLNVSEVRKFQIGGLEVAYAFYNLYGKMNGFGI